MPPKKLPELPRGVRHTISEFAGRERRLPSDWQELAIARSLTDFQAARVYLSAEDAHIAAGNIFGTTQAEYDAMVEDVYNKETKYLLSLKQYLGYKPLYETWNWFWKDDFYPKPPPPPGGGKRPMRTYAR